MTSKLTLGLSIAASALLIAASAATAGEAEGGRKLQTNLTGAAEVPGPGDPDGAGVATVTVNPGQNRVCFTLAVTNIVPATAAHIHIGAPSVAGPVVVGLTAPTSGTSSGCVTVLRSLALAILKNPPAYYVNVHNAVYPAGAVRGQLAK